MKLVCLGDSLTEGYEINRKLRWTKLLSNKLCIPIVNSGISGDTTAGMVGRVDSDVIRHSPTHIILLGGTNDLYFDLDINYIISNLKTILRQARYHKLTYLLGLPTMIYLDAESDTGLFISRSQLQDKILDFRQQLTAFAKEDGLITIDFNAGLSKEHFLADGVHPNEAAQVIICENVADVLGGLEEES